MFFINLPTEKLMHDTTYLVTFYWKRVHNYLDTSEAVFCMFISQMALVSWFKYHLGKASLQR